jgi:2-methylcitrate dehydratase PrpD
MCKPLHAGKAAANGLLSAALAARGFTGNPEIVEAHQGFAATHAESLTGLEALDTLDDRYLIRETLFKYHAACYLTHGVIEGALLLRRRHEIAPNNVATVDVEVGPEVLDVANIEAPRTGLEGKFSLRAVTAMALLGDDTSDPAAYSDERMADSELIALRDRVRGRADEPAPASGSVRLCTTDGRELVASVDTTVPAADLDLQQERLMAKFRALAGPVVGEDRAEALAEMVDRLEKLDRVGELTRMCVP